MDEKERIKHLQKVMDCLPPDVRALARIKTYGPTLSVGETGRGYGSAVDVKLERTYCRVDRCFIRAELDYRVKTDLKLKTRSWKRRERDNLFSYDRVAAFITKVIRDNNALLARRTTGESLANKRADKLKEIFTKDPLLNALGMKVGTSATRDTEVGEVEVSFGSFSHGAELKFNGSDFTGVVRVSQLSAEQVAAIMAVINVDRLPILDKMVLATDSILGPSIQKLIEERD